MPSRSPGSTLFPYTTPSDLNSRTEDAHVGVGVQELHGAHERVLFEHGVWVEQEHVPSGRACQSLIAGARKAQILPVGLQLYPRAGGGIAAGLVDDIPQHVPRVI